MAWHSYPYYYIFTILVWIVALSSWFFGNNRILQRNWLRIGSLTGMLIIGAFLAHLWVELERPPLRTMGETRLWYAFLLPAVGLMIDIRWQYRWLLSYSLVLSSVFLTILLLKPDIFDQALMPALQSIWFVPHVLVYMISYAFLAASFIIGIKGLSDLRKAKEVRHLLLLADNVVYMGIGFMTIGFLFGAIWAKEAWGNYWSWDPKETWAFLTWFAYLLYIHYRRYKSAHQKSAFVLLIIAFVILIICWMGVNYLPSAQGSMHVY